MSDIDEDKLCEFCGFEIQGDDGVMTAKGMMHESCADSVFPVDRLRIGLRHQGHIPTVEKMLAEGATWDEIGEAIGWHGPTAEKWYGFEQEHGVKNES